MAIYRFPSDTNEQLFRERLDELSIAYGWILGIDGIAVASEDPRVDIAARELGGREVTEDY